MHFGCLCDCVMPSFRTKLILTIKKKRNHIRCTSLACFGEVHDIPSLYMTRFKSDVARIFNGSDINFSCKLMHVHQTRNYTTCRIQPHVVYAEILCFSFIKIRVMLIYAKTIFFLVAVFEEFSSHLFLCKHFDDLV